MWPFSAKNIEQDSDGADVTKNNWHAKKAYSGVNVKKHITQIIKMDKVTTHSIAYIACQVTHHNGVCSDRLTVTTLAGVICVIFH